MPVGSTITRDDQHAAEHHLPVLRARHRVDLEIVERNGADDGPREGAKSAEHGHEDDLARERPIEDFGRGEAVERHPQHAGKTRSKQPEMTKAIQR